MGLVDIYKRAIKERGVSSSDAERVILTHVNAGFNDGVEITYDLDSGAVSVFITIYGTDKRPNFRVKLPEEIKISLEVLERGEADDILQAEVDKYFEGLEAQISKVVKKMLRKFDSELGRVINNVIANYNKNY